MLFHIVHVLTSIFRSTAFRRQHLFCYATALNVVFVPRVCRISLSRSLSLHTWMMSATRRSSGTAQHRLSVVSGIPISSNCISRLILEHVVHAKIVTSVPDRRSRCALSPLYHTETPIGCYARCVHTSVIDAATLFY